VIVAVTHRCLQSASQGEHTYINKHAHAHAHTHTHIYVYIYSGVLVACFLVAGPEWAWTFATAARRATVFETGEWETRLHIGLVRAS